MLKIFFRRKPIVLITLFIVTFFSFFTYVYPYSIFSLHKSVTFNTPWGTSNGLTYNEVLEDFQIDYDKHRIKANDGTDYNLVVLRTEYILSLFKQQWLLDDAKTEFDYEELQTAKSTIAGVKNLMFDFLIELNLSSDQKDYLRLLMQSLDYQLTEIDQLMDHPYYTRKTIKRIYGNLEQSYTALFSVYRSFYESTLQSPPQLTRQ